MTEPLRLPRSHFDELVAHAREEAPNECCGMMAAENGRTVQVIRARNIHRSPLRYEVHPEDLRHVVPIDDAGQQLVIYHSHTRTDPVPSQTDINHSEGYPDAIYVIVGVKGPEADVRGWKLFWGEGRYEPVELIVE